jgi:hypothetical protein
LNFGEKYQAGSDLKVGLPKGHKVTAYGCYASKNQTITVLNSDVLVNSFVIHEFYHHIRSKSVDRILKEPKKALTNSA